MATDHSNVYGSTSFYKKCVTAISGINAKSLTTETTCEVKKTPDECGQNIQLFTRNVVSSSDFEGEVTGGSPGGICVQDVGVSMTDPGAFLSNMATVGDVMVCTRARYTEAGGEYAKFSATGENNSYI